MNPLVNAIDANLRVLRLQEENERLRAALRELDWHNPLHNDFDTYLHELAQWGLGKIDARPDPVEYGLNVLIPDNVRALVAVRPEESEETK